MEPMASMNAPIDEYRFEARDVNDLLHGDMLGDMVWDEFNRGVKQTLIVIPTYKVIEFVRNTASVWAQGVTLHITRNELEDAELISPFVVHAINGLRELDKIDEPFVFLTNKVPR